MRISRTCDVWINRTCYMRINRACYVWVDGAYTDKTSNDPTGILICGYKKPYLYIIFATSLYLRITDLIKRIPVLAKHFNVGRKSRIFIEPRASGHDIKALLEENGWNSILIKGKVVSDGKTARGESAGPACESGRVILIEGNWVNPFLENITGFPYLKHDEDADNLGYAVHNYLIRKRRRGVRHRR